jgi:serine/threonine-protein kinase
MSAADRDDQGSDHDARDDGARAGQARDEPDEGLADGSAPTEIRPAAGEPPPMGPSGTRILPPVPDSEPQPRWAARASVPSPQPVAEPQEVVEPGWGERRGALVPVLVTVCVVLLLGLFVLGAWLALSNRPDPAGAPPASPEPTQTSAAPSSPAAPSPTPTTSAPAAVAIPDLAGLSYDEAAAELTELGFTPERRDEPSGTVPAGEVIRTEPPAGTTLRPAPGIKVVVVVSHGLPEPTGQPSMPDPTPAIPPSR